MTAWLQCDHLLAEGTCDASLPGLSPDGMASEVAMCNAIHAALEGYTARTVSIAELADWTLGQPFASCALGASGGGAGCPAPGTRIRAAGSGAAGPGLWLVRDDGDVKSRSGCDSRPGPKVPHVGSQHGAPKASGRDENEHVRQMIPRPQRPMQPDTPGDQTAGMRPLLRGGGKQAVHPAHRVGHAIDQQRIGA